ncbi:MAG TPA: hypothetical protein PLK31_06970 [Chloroflexota bacterium]|nr:hypothetical protein [Chloroflexota bacterium]
MMDSIWPSVQEAFQAIGPHYQPQTGPFVTEAGYQDGDWFISFIACGLDPEPLTAVTLQKKLFVYSHPDRVQQLLTGATERGFLAENQPGQYSLTKKGRDGMARFFEIAWDASAELLPIPEPEMEVLARLLYRVVAATETAAKPAIKTNLKVSRRTDPGLDGPAIVRIDQYLTDLLRYRDDAHIAVWSAHGVSGPAWEAFTTIWRGDVQTTAELVEKLPNRGHTAVAYDEALATLVQKGWLTVQDEVYAVTAVGQQIRDAAELETEENFNVGLWALDAAEIKTLHALLAQFKEKMIISELAPV